MGGGDLSNRTCEQIGRTDGRKMAAFAKDRHSASNEDGADDCMENEITD